MKRRLYGRSIIRSAGSLILLLVGTAGGLQPDAFFDASSSSRRDFVAAATTILATSSGAIVGAPPPETDSEPAIIGATGGPSGDPPGRDAPPPERLSRELLASIPVPGSGAPATNATVSPEASTRIEGLASLLENRQQRDNARSSRLAGSWRLRYSNAPEIVGLARGLPLGFALGPTYQPLDPAGGFFENTARLDHPYGLASGSTDVVGRVAPGTPGSVNAAGVVDSRSNRVDIRFEAIIFEVDALLGRPLDPPIRKTLVPAAARDPGGAVPANDQTYLDDRIRIVRGGDGSLFVFSRATDDDSDSDGAKPMRTAAERAELLAEASSSAASGSAPTPVGEDLKREERSATNGDGAIPAEIRYLFRGRAR